MPLAVGASVLFTSALSLARSARLETRDACKHGAAELAISRAEVYLAVNSDYLRPEVHKRVEVTGISEKPVEVNGDDHSEVFADSCQHSTPAGLGTSRFGGACFVVRERVDDLPASRFGHLGAPDQLAFDTFGTVQ